MEKRITGHTELLGLIATPIRHSKSPVMHNAACRALGLDYAYLAFDIQPDQLEDAVKGFKALNVRGWNVSMPYKTTIGQYLDHITPIAKMCGAINTVINDHGVLTGTITDGTGYMTALKDQGIDIEVAAYPLTQAEKVIDEWDVVMLGPQVRHCLPQLQKATNITPIEVIDMKDYGLMNGANVLKKALEIVNNK